MRAAATAAPAPIALDRLNPAAPPNPAHEVTLEAQVDAKQLIDIKDSEGRIIALVSPLYAPSATSATGALRAVLVVDDQTSNAQLSAWESGQAGAIGPILRINGRISDNGSLRDYARDALGDDIVTAPTMIVEGFAKGRTAALQPENDYSTLSIGAVAALLFAGLGLFFRREPGSPPQQVNVG
jgi:hypothetical protein